MDEKKFFLIMAIIAVLGIVSGIFIQQLGLKKHELYIKEQVAKATKPKSAIEVTVNEEQMGMLKDTIEAFSLNGKLQYKIAIDKNVIMVKADGEPNSILSNYNDIRAMLHFVGSLPVRAQFNKMCIGENCGFEYVLNVYGF